MKRIKHIILTGVCTLAFASCHDLDITSPSVLQDDAVFNSETGITSYFANIYKDLPIEEFKYRIDRGYRYNKGNEWENFHKNGMVCGEVLGPKGSVWDVVKEFGDNDGAGPYWPYRKIREVNYLLETLPEKAVSFRKEQVDGWLGEAYFMRAFFYLEMVKRYGGIPIIEKPLYYPEQSIPELQLPRNKEIDVWKFIESDLKKAEEMLPETNSSSRANRYVAATLRSRAMLFAAGVAKYGDNDAEGPARQQGFVGILATEAAYFFKSASEAADIVINGGKYDLYDTGGDKEENYINIFMNADSKEVIYRVDYSRQARYDDYSHNWDAVQYCNALGGGLGHNTPTLDIVERHLGGPGSIDQYILNEDGTPRRFDKLEDLKAAIDNPRLFATILFPGEVVRKDRYVDVRAGIYRTFKGTAQDEMSYEHPEWPGYMPYRPNRDNPDGSTQSPRNLFTSNTTVATLTKDDNVLNSKGEVSEMAIIGTSGMGQGEVTRTGFYCRKYVDPKKGVDDIGWNACTQSWLAMRYAEVLLNKAEAVAEMGDLDEAQKQIKKIRTRAGLTTPDVIDLEYIRNERRVELCFENFIWWDLKRWRTATAELNRTKFYALRPYYVANEDKYIFLKEYATNEFDCEKHWYYVGLPGDELKKNPNLYPNNPLY